MNWGKEGRYVLPQREAGGTGPRAHDGGPLVVGGVDTHLLTHGHGLVHSRGKPRPVQHGYAFNSYSTKSDLNL
jgi:hypothetical protein